LDGFDSFVSFAGEGYVLPGFSVKAMFSCWSTRPNALLNCAMFCFVSDTTAERSTLLSSTAWVTSTGGEWRVSVGVGSVCSSASVDWLSPMLSTTHGVAGVSVVPGVIACCSRCMNRGMG
jgi:hypothetical protein